MTLRQEERHDDRRHVVNNPNDAAPRETALVAGSSVAARLSRLYGRLFLDGSPIRFEMWDHSALGPEESIGALILRSPAALRRMLWSPNEIGLARAYIMGEIDIEDDLFETLKALHRATTKRQVAPQTLWSAIVAALRLGAIGSPPKARDEEVRLSGWRHSKARDAAAISHHYDVSSDFYRLVSGPAMTVLLCSVRVTRQDTTAPLRRVGVVGRVVPSPGQSTPGLRRAEPSTPDELGASRLLGVDLVEVKRGIAS
jgi:hypothetical protein